MDLNAQNCLSKNEKLEQLKKRYLFCYNLIQCLGWSFVLYQMLCYFQFSDKAVSLFDSVKVPLLIFQCGAFLEYFHAKYKLTKSSPAVTLIQIYSRIMVLLAVLIAVAPSRSSSGLPMLLIAWSVTEIIRYLNYTLSTYGQAPYFIVWLRYTTFIPLYPLGVTGELLCMYAAAAVVRHTNQWSLDFPNMYNTVFYYHHYLILSMLLYIPFFPKLYLHMFKQRVKVLGSQKAEGKAA